MLPNKPHSKGSSTQLSYGLGILQPERSLCAHFSRNLLFSWFTSASTTNRDLHHQPQPALSAINTAVIITISRGLHYQSWLLPSAMASSITHPGLHTQPQPLPSTTASTPSHSLEQPPLPSSDVAFVSNLNGHHQACSLHQPWDPAQLPLLLSAMLTCHSSLVPSCFFPYTITLLPFYCGLSKGV